MQGDEPPANPRDSTPFRHPKEEVSSSSRRVPSPFISRRLVFDGVSASPPLSSSPASSSFNPSSSLQPPSSFRPGSFFLPLGDEPLPSTSVHRSPMKARTSLPPLKSLYAEEDMDKELKDIESKLGATPLRDSGSARLRPLPESGSTTPLNLSSEGDPSTPAIASSLNESAGTPSSSPIPAPQSAPIRRNRSEDLMMTQEAASQFSSSSALLGPSSPATPSSSRPHSRLVSPISTPTESGNTSPLNSTRGSLAEEDLIPPPQMNFFEQASVLIAPPTSQTLPGPLPWPTSSSRSRLISGWLSGIGPERPPLAGSQRRECRRARSSQRSG